MNEMETSPVGDCKVQVLAANNIFVMSSWGCAEELKDKVRPTLSSNLYPFKIKIFNGENK
jgi:peroxiredoxin